MAYLTLENLITEDGDVDPAVYRHMVRRRAQTEYGSLAPRALRAAIRHYAAIIPILTAHRLAQRAAVRS
jgi:hypothetical protein